jgi:hypothetical protein
MTQKDLSLEYRAMSHEKAAAIQRLRGAHKRMGTLADLANTRSVRRKRADAEEEYRAALSDVKQFRVYVCDAKRDLDYVCTFSAIEDCKDDLQAQMEEAGLTVKFYPMDEKKMAEWLQSELSRDVSHNGFVRLPQAVKVVALRINTVTTCNQRVFATLRFTSAGVVADPHQEYSPEWYSITAHGIEKLAQLFMDRVSLTPDDSTTMDVVECTDYNGSHVNVVGCYEDVINIIHDALVPDVDGRAKTCWHVV